MVQADNPDRICELVKKVKCVTKISVTRFFIG